VVARYSAPVSTHLRSRRPKPITWRALFPAVILLLVFLLSDYYVQGLGRPFDYVGLFLLSVAVAPILSHKQFGALPTQTGAGILILAYGMVFGLIANDAALTVGAIFCGVAIAFPATALIMRTIPKDTQIAAINFALLVSASIFFLQYAIFQLTGNYVDIVHFLGSSSTSRGLNVDLGFFRPHGIFQEPNAYCGVMFALLVICRLFARRNRVIEIVAISSLFVSGSLWGLGAGLLAIYLLFGWRWLLFGILSIFFTAILLPSLTDALMGRAQSTIMFNRLVNLDQDASTAGRYLGGSGVSDVVFEVLFGKGVSPNEFQGYLGANGFSFLLYSFGLVGALLFLGWLFWILRWSAALFAAAIFLMTTFPYFSYMFFWSWIGILCANSSATTVKPPTPRQGRPFAPWAKVKRHRIQGPRLVKPGALVTVRTCETPIPPRHSN
jgi:hypothetical protein